MTSDEDSQDIGLGDTGTEESKNEFKFIADKVALHPEILSKSQIPTVKRKKENAIEKIVYKYETIFGKKIDAAKFLKKVNNMKTRLKKKTDVNKTGNKRIKLLEWEKVMFDAMQGETYPTVSKIGGAKICGIAFKTDDADSASTSTLTNDITDLSTKAPQTSLKRKSTLQKYETDETRNLTTAEIQRLVLLEQLATTRVQKEYYSLKLEKLREKNTQECDDAVVQKSKVFYQL